MKNPLSFSRFRPSWGLCLLGLLLLFQLSAQGRTWYAKTDSSAVNDGQSWNTATALLTALSKAQPGDQVWVQQGTYFLIRNEEYSHMDFATKKIIANRTFRIPSGVKVYGGFLGDESQVAARHGTQSILRSSTLNPYAVTFFNANAETLLDGFLIIGAPSGKVIEGDDADVYYDPNLFGPGQGGNVRPTYYPDVFGLGPGFNSGLFLGHSIINMAYQGTSEPTVTNCEIDLAGVGFYGGMITNFAYQASSHANLRVLNCSLNRGVGIQTLGSTIVNYGYETGDADLLLYNCRMENVRIEPVRGGEFVNANVVSALMINAGNANSTTRAVNCQILESGGIRYDMTPNGPFYILANVFEGGPSELVNCYLDRISNTSTSEVIGWPVGFTSNVKLSHSIFGIGVPDHDVSINPPPGQGYASESIVYGAPTDPGQHLINTANGTPSVGPCTSLLTDRGDNTLLERWPDLATVPGLAERLANGPIDIGPDESNPNVYLQTTTGATSLTVAKGTSDITLLGKFCGGTVNWTANNGTSGQGSIIAVATNQVGKVTYQATCTTNSCTSSSSFVSVTVFDSSVSPPSDLTFQNDGPLTCSQTQVTLTASTTATGVSYSIRGPNGTISAGSSGNSTSVNLPGSYTVTATNDGGSATAITVVSSQTALAAPDWSASGPASVTVTQGASAVFLNATNCSGTLRWTGPGSTTGTGSVSVPTSAPGIFVYSAVCHVGSCVSPPTSATVTVTAPVVVTGNFEGFLTTVNCQEMRGWVWDRNKPNTPLTVEFFAENTAIGTIEAKNFRQDLKDAGKGNGEHGYVFPTPEAAKTGSELRISAKVQGTDYLLKGSPIKLTCPASNTVINQPPVAPTTEPLSATVGVAVTTLLPSFTDPEGQPLTYALNGLPDGLQFAAISRTITGSPTVEGTFLLSYSASDSQKAASVGLTLVVAPGASTPPVVTGSFEGFLDKVECGSIRGWVWDRNKPNSPLTVQFFADGVAVGTTEASIYRDDLKTAGKGNGAHAYSFTTPVGLKDNVRRQISAKVLGSSYTLKDSPKPLQCAPLARLSAETGSELQVTVLGNPVSETIQVEIRGAEGLPLRLQLTDASGRLVGQRQIESAKTIEQQRLSVQGQPAGLLLLRVTSGLKSVTLKLLKQ
ncbi:T9SS type A sorting domain-containing protein [Larkinella rosea]|uniref:T9SS C-terminal target domain-containing protein n=1 Tax=Larkinella rosea TaxID=2025312 RepID=A0A3P1BIP5_9BACT|nr:T9SS type A sorting domain-containing protein [Larkinella rosea]RRB00865.1 T9SS C-terminal target domain-containing protein [Larkinella rosea]